MLAWQSGMPTPGLPHSQHRPGGAQPPPEASLGSSVGRAGRAPGHGGLNAWHHVSPGQVGTQEASSFPLRPWQGRMQEGLHGAAVGMDTKYGPQELPLDLCNMSGLHNRNYCPCFIDEETEASGPYRACPKSQPGSKRARTSPRHELGCIPCSVHSAPTALRTGFQATRCRSDGGHSHDEGDAQPTRPMECSAGLHLG